MGQKSSKNKQVLLLISALKSRKDEIRSLLRTCFKDQMFSLVPFEIWRDLIVSNVEMKAITILSQTCYAFKEIVDNIGENNFNLALMFRRVGQIDLAKKYLLLCAENNNSLAMFHVGYAIRNYCWGLSVKSGIKIGVDSWYKKSSELGNFHAMVHFSECFRYGFGVSKNMELSDVWAKKALSSKDSLAIGLCYYSELGTKRDNEKAFVCFEVSAKEGDEFGQYYLGNCFCFGLGTDKNDEKALYWWLKSAEQGHCYAQYRVGRAHHYGIGCEKDEQKAIIWYKKSAKQGGLDSIISLKKMGIEVE